MILPDPPLLLVTDSRQAQRPLIEVISAALDAGCRWVSLREKHLSVEAQLSLARGLSPIARHFGARLTLHGDPALAVAGHLDGIHLAADGDAASARHLLGAERLVGLSIHTHAEAAAADPAVVDYAVAGPVYETASKPGYGPALASAGLATLVAASRVPVIAIGGIEAERIAEIMAAGAAGIAVMGGVMRVDDPAAEMRKLIAALRG